VAIESHHFEIMAEAIREAEIGVADGGSPIGTALTPKQPR
jgi:cytosine/creatinine deaminase